MARRAQTGPRAKPSATPARAERAARLGSARGATLRYAPPPARSARSAAPPQAGPSAFSGGHPPCAGSFASSLRATPPSLRSGPSRRVPSASLSGPVGFAPRRAPGAGAPSTLRFVLAGPPRSPRVGARGGSALDALRPGIRRPPKLSPLRSDRWIAHVRSRVKVLAFGCAQTRSLPLAWCSGQGLGITTKFTDRYFVFNK